MTLREVVGQIRFRSAARKLRSHDGITRLWGVRRLGKLGTPQAIDLLVLALHDDHVSVRNEAAELLGRMGWSPNSDSDRAEYAVASRNWDQAVRLGSPAEGALIRLLDDLGGDVREHTVRCLGQVGTAAAFDRLVLVLDSDPSWSVRIASVHALCQFAARGDQRVVDVLLRALDANDSPGVQRAVIYALGEIGDLRSVDRLIGALHTDRREAVKALETAATKKGSSSAVDALVSALQDPSAAVRYEAAIALGKMGYSPSVGPLAEALEHGYYSLDWEAVRTDLFDSVPVGALLSALDKASGCQARRAIVRALGRVASRTQSGDALRDEVIGLLTQVARAARDQVFEYEEVSVALAAIDALGAIGGLQCIDVLTTIMRAVNVPGCLGGATNTEAVRNAAAEALVRIGPASIPALQELLNAPHWLVRGGAEKAISRIASQESGEVHKRSERAGSHA